MYTILSKYDETYNIVRFYGSGGVKDGDCYKPSLVKNILRVPYHMALSIKSSLTNHNQYLLAKEREKNFLEFNKYIYIYLYYGVIGFVTKVNFFIL